MPRHARTRKLDRAIPKDLVKRIAKPIIHRPQMVPANTSLAGLQFPSQAWAKRKERRFNIWALTHPNKRKRVA